MSRVDTNMTNDKALGEMLGARGLDGTSLPDIRAFAKDGWVDHYELIYTKKIPVQDKAEAERVFRSEVTRALRRYPFARFELRSVKDENDRITHHEIMTSANHKVKPIYCVN